MLESAVATFVSEVITLGVTKREALAALEEVWNARNS